jgi:tetratricopeptide (TPR) repeat protein
MSYFLQGVPEMAALQFSKAVANGSSEDYLHWGEMLIDAGMQDSAYAVMRRGRAQYPELVDRVSREEFMLLKAHGEPLAVIMGGLDNLTRDEFVRISRYAAQAGNFPYALDNFRTMIDEDSSDATPYLEMGRLYLQYDTAPLLAVENLQYGVSLFPKDTRLKVELAHAFTLAGQLNRAETAIQGISVENAAEPFRFAYVMAKLKAAKGDTAAAKEDLKTLHQQRPLNTEVLLALGPLLQNQEDGISGQQIFYEALQRNHLNKDLWLQMAAFERIVGRPEEAGHAAVNAINLAQSEPEKLKIAEKYAEEIRILKTKDF